LILVSLFDGALASRIAPRLVALFLVGALFAFARYRQDAHADKGEASLGNPVELGRAVFLAIVFAAILLAARAAEARFGTRGLWAAGLLGGLVDVDSVAVAAARLRQQGLADVGAASGSVLLATLSNLALKGALVAVIGGAPLARAVLPAFATLAAVTGLLLVLP
jgi:uncharacterized membrane protein (DUF4010 family)